MKERVRKCPVRIWGWTRLWSVRSDLTNSHFSSGSFLGRHEREPFTFSERTKARFYQRGVLLWIKISILKDWVLISILNFLMPRSFESTHSLHMKSIFIGTHLSDIFRLLLAWNCLTAFTIRKTSPCRHPENQAFNTFNVKCYYT